MSMSFFDLIKLFEWAVLKARISASSSVLPVACVRDVWWASLGQNIGVEVNGKNNSFERPVLVMKVFNADSLFAVPLTTTERENAHLIKFKDPSGRDTSANISQLRLISSKRLLHKSGQITENDFNLISSRIAGLFITKKAPETGTSSGFTRV